VTVERGRRSQRGMTGTEPLREIRRGALNCQYSMPYAEVRACESRNPPGKTSADSEYQPVDPQVKNKKDSVKVSRKKFFKLASCSGVDDQPRIDSAGAQQARK
jgi:hypothetical protein